MTTTVAALPCLPRIARLGFDDGWLILNPTFLNFGVPGVLIDYQLVGPTDLGLEPLGTRNPTTPWARATAHLRRNGGTLALWTDDPPTLVVERWLDLGARIIDGGHRQMILLIGDTRAVQLSWSALWGCSIGMIPATELTTGNATVTVPPLRTSCPDLPSPHVGCNRSSEPEL